MMACGCKGECKHIFYGASHCIHEDCENGIYNCPRVKK